MNSVTDKLKEKYQGKKVLVVGLGLQGGGVGMAKFFCELGAKVTVIDKRTKSQLLASLQKLQDLGISYHFGDHELRHFLETDFIFKGPSIKWDLPGLIKAEEKAIPVEMELSFFSEHCPARIIGVTGTRGKSTTTNMIFKLLKDNGLNPYLAGNIPGISTISLLNTVTERDWIVMELASWPLSGFDRKKISPHISVFTNFYPDHLNYYQSMDHYLQDKKAIYKHQKSNDHLIINSVLKPFIQKDYIKSKIHFFSPADWKYPFEYIEGDHNRENAAAALITGEILKFNKQITIRSISSFKGLPYRQEIVGEKENVIFVNDTTSTTPIAVIKALDTFAKNKSIYLILGGTSKNLPHDILIKRLAAVEKIILIAGSFTDEILPLLNRLYYDKITDVFSDLRKAVVYAYKLAKKTGGYVLFSPGAPSFAMFNNEFHRGDEFNKIVNSITNIKRQISKIKVL